MNQAPLRFGNQAVPSRSGDLRVCPECRTPFEPYKRAEGRQVYCSPDCRSRHWKVEHGQAKPVPISDKRTRAQKVLDRLKQGRATGLDLLKAGGGTCFRDQILKLRQQGHYIVGSRPCTIWRDNQDYHLPAMLPKMDAGHDQYELREE